MRVRKPIWARWLVCLAVLAMFAASCGSGGDDSAASETVATDDSSSSESETAPDEPAEAD